MLEPVERVLRVAEVPVERPVAQLEEVLHRRALAAPAAPRARQAAVGPRFDKNGHLGARYFQNTWKFQASNVVRQNSDRNCDPKHQDVHESN